MSPNGNCHHCGAPLLGDGYTQVLHCENADLDLVWETEPDAQPVECAFADGEGVPEARLQPPAT